MTFFNTVKEKAKLIRQRASQFEQNRRVQRVNKKRVGLADLENKRKNMQEEYELDRARERELSQINRMKSNSTPQGLGGIFTGFGNNVRANLGRNIQKAKSETRNNIFTQGSGSNPYSFMQPTKRIVKKKKKKTIVIYS
jgi:hypothetical protein